MSRVTPSILMLSLLLITSLLILKRGSGHGTFLWVVKYTDLDLEALRGNPVKVLLKVIIIFG